MTKTTCIVLVLLGLLSCRSQKDIGGWNSDLRKIFMAECKKPLDGVISKKAARNICTCGLDKLMEKYPDPATIDMEVAKKVGEECAQEYLNN